MSEFIKQLNKEQEVAATHNEGPLLVVAGAGTGKTTVLIERLNYLIKNKLAGPDEILITTFTEKAAGEMEERADKVLPYGYVDLWINTFHGFCERILRDHALDIGLPGDFKLLSQTEQWMMIRNHLDEFNLEYYKPLGNPTKFIHELIKHFSRLKDENISSIDYIACAKKHCTQGHPLLPCNSPCHSEQSGAKSKNPVLDAAMLDLRDPSANTQDDSVSKEELMEQKRLVEVAGAYQKYNQLLLENSFLDFGDLIAYTIKLFRERPNILKIYQQKFKYIMVDEFQDTNYSQYELIKLLAAPKNNLMVVGDDDQSIYAFRGSSMHNIMQFSEDYPNTKEVVLNKNYRSGQEILDASYDFIRKNDPNRLEVKLGIDKKLDSPINKTGVVTHLHYGTEAEETETVVQMIGDICSNDKELNWSDFAILVRANNTAIKFVNELDRRGIPNQFVSLRGLYYKSIIVDAISYFKLLDNYHESSALFRVLNMDIFKVDHADIVNINKFARRKVWSTFEALKNIDLISSVEDKTKGRVKKLLDLVEKHSQLVKQSVPSKIFLSFMKESGLLKGLDQDRDREIFDYLNQFYQKIKTFESNDADLRLNDFMRAFEMELESGETGSLKNSYDDADVVKVMTVHAAKGLEFEYVFMPCVVDKKFPVIKRKEKIVIPDELVKVKAPEGNFHVEEERRLFYVAITRAKKELFLTTASDYGGAREKKISKFLVEMGFDSHNTQQITRNTKENELVKELNRKEIVKSTEMKYVLPKKYSFSQLEAFSNCPQQYKYSFILKIPAEDKVSFIFGRVVHNVLKDFFDMTISGDVFQKSLFTEQKNNVLSLRGGVNAMTRQSHEKTENVDHRDCHVAPTPRNDRELPTKHDLLNFYKKRWVDNGFKTKKEREEYLEKGKRIFSDFFDKLESEGWPKVLFTEKGFNVKIGGYTLRGSIDRIDKLDNGTVEIVDYKTGNPKEKLDIKSKRQLILYKIAVEQTLGLKVSKLSFYYLENNTVISFEAKDKEVKKLEIQVVEQIKEIQKCNFKAKPGFLCDYCDFNGICEDRK